MKSTNGNAEHAQRAKLVRFKPHLAPFLPKAKKEDSFFNESLTWEMGFAISSGYVLICSGLSAILRSEAQNDAVCCRLWTASIDPGSLLR